MTSGARNKASILLVVTLTTALAGWFVVRRLRPADRRSVLIVTIDTLRADHLSCYGYGRDTTPNIDALAREGVLFEQATTPRPKTGPSMVSMLTGLYPHEHGVRTNFDALPSARCVTGARAAVRPDPTSPGALAERLGVAGLATGACVANFVLTKELSGLERGFEHYDDELTSSELNRPQMRERKADENTRAALAWLRDHADERFFLWVHYIDPHGAYTPPPAFDRFRGMSDARVPLAAMREELPLDQSGRRVFVAPHNMLVDPQTGRTDNRLARYIDSYDGEIAFVDDAIGRLLDELSALERIDDTLIVLTADHGEALGEHSVFFEHGYYVYEPDLRVPFIVRVPPHERFAAGARSETPAAGRRVAAPVDLLDVMPTVLEWLELEPDMPLSGRSLVPILAGGAGDPERVIFTERVEFGFEVYAARTPAWKLIVNQAHPPEWPLPWPRELYDLRADPSESDNLHGSDQVRVRQAERELGGRLQAWLTAADTGGSRAGEDRAALERLTDEARTRLEAMGYTGDVDGDVEPPPAGAAAHESGGEAGQTPSVDPLAVLRHALATGDGALRALALEGLSRAGALDDLAPYLAASQPLAVRVRAVELIGELGRADLAEVLAEAAANARDDEHALRMAATYALVRLGANAGVEELARSTRHWNAGLRALAAWYLGQLARAPAQEALVPLCGDPSGTVRVFAWQALARSGSAGAAAELARAAREGDPQTAAAAVRVLGEIGSPLETRELVADLRRATHPALVEAGEVLAWWTSPGEAQRAWSSRRSLSVDARRAVVHALGSTLGDAARSALREALADEDAEVRVLAASHLARLDGR